MVRAYMDMNCISQVKELLYQLKGDVQIETLRPIFHHFIQTIDKLDLLLILNEIKQTDETITYDIIKNFTYFYKEILDDSLLTIDIPDSENKNHPIQLFQRENDLLHVIITQIRQMISENVSDSYEALVQELHQLEDIFKHYSRKEKLYFPILERYGIYIPLRTMWANDDRVRSLYKGTKHMVIHMNKLDYSYIEQTWEKLEEAYIDMIRHETYFLLPITKLLFKEEDWLAISKESKAFGYAFIDEVEEWSPNCCNTSIEEETKLTEEEHIRFGGGFLTISEANTILNNLPVEITFVDKNGIFKYFNEVVEASDMMFIRTPTSIGRNVANCHPPKSLNKVLNVIRELKSRKRSTVTMWFKKKNQFIYVTYKGLFDENDEYLGILEYVQDIQPFFELPREMNRDVK